MPLSCRDSFTWRPIYPRNPFVSQELGVTRRTAFSRPRSCMALLDLPVDNVKIKYYSGLHAGSLVDGLCISIFPYLGYLHFSVRSRAV